MIVWLRWNWATLLILVSLSSPALAQLKTKVRPQASFRMSPLVVHASARPGQVIPFEIEIDAYRKSVDLLVEPSGIVQQPTGLILPDGQSQPFGKIFIHGTKNLRLKKGEKQILRGTWRIPVDASGFLASGLLITEQQSPHDFSANFAHRQVASVRFVTRYLLRLEAMVSTRSQIDAVPTVHSVRLVNREGRAWVTAQLQAPPKGTGNMRLKASARIRDAQGRDVTREFPLRLPVRDNQPLPSRDQIPLLANSRVVVHAAVPEPLFAGSYEVVVTAGDPNRRKTKTVSEPCDVAIDEFPAQRSVVTQVVRDVEVSPSQLELSVARGGKRLLPLALRNRADHEIEVELGTLDCEGRGLDWVVLRPKKFTLQAGRERKVLVAVRGGTNHSANRYGRIVVAVSAKNTTSHGEQELPIALIGETSTSELDGTFGQATWKSTGNRGAFLIPISNKGLRHLSLHGKLAATDHLGRQFESEGGFGQWVLPGETETLSFPTVALPPGDYDVQFEIATEAGAVPQVTRRTVKVLSSSLN